MKFDRKRIGWQKMVSSVRFLGGGRGFRGLFVRGYLDDCGALDVAADTFALD